MRSSKSVTRPGIGQPIRDSFRVLGRYVRAQILIGLILTGLYGIAFWIAQVPWWLLIAVIGGAASVIPTIGSLVPIGLAALAIVLSGGSMEQLLIAFIAWILISAIEGFILTPKMLSRQLGLRSLSVFGALLAGSLLFGPIGFLLAAPTLAIGAIFWRYFQARKQNVP